MVKSMRCGLPEYLAVKAQHRDAVLFWRVGDFCEMYFDDALVTAKTLGISCTTRQDWPMSGVPWHSASAFLVRMVRAGFRVAVCEPRELHARQGGTKYEVVRIVSPGLDSARGEWAPPLPKVNPIDSLRTTMQEFEEKSRADRQELKKAVRKLYEEQTGQKWRPALRVIQGGGNTTPITRKVTRHKKPLP
ncbi:MAG: DNA mismatch repair protein MutS [uncultured bacterium]|nr:MAG: DNA mismatch repair protein MutS [uncultured bacterium]